MYFFLWWQSLTHTHTHTHTDTHTHTHTLTETERSTLFKSASVKYGWIIGSVFDVSGLQTSFMPRGRCSMIIALITSNIYSTFCFLLQVSDDAREPQFLICRDQICLLDKDRPSVSENRRVLWHFIRRLKHAPFIIYNSSA